MTSMMAALARGLHRQLHAPPWILDDPYALSLVGPGWRDLYAALTKAFREPLRDEGIGFITVRSRYAEDRLVEGSFSQYVVLGAGLDSFAWRRPDLLGALRVFEVDHPATQAWKQSRAADLSLPTADNHVFVPLDFETQTLREGLDAAEFDWSAPTLFSWLGVISYLTTDAVKATLDNLRDCAAGSEIVLSYSPTAEFFDDHGREFQDVLIRLASASGEPIQNLGSPDEAEEIFTGCGLQVIEHLTPEEIHDRFFATRPDGLRPYTVERLLTAAIGAENERTSHA
jgi:methyltransferase (TIGR00027 family)